MNKRHQRMVQRILAMLKAEPDYDGIDEIRILNDGGGTGTWHVAIKLHGKMIRAANFSMLSIYAPCELVSGSEYYDLSDDRKEFL